MAGVDPTEQGLDEPVDDLVTEPGGHQVADGDVVGDPGVGLVGGAGQPFRAEHSAGGELVEVERHTHQRPRHRPEPATRPDARRGTGRVHDLGADLAGEVDALGPAGEHRLRPDVDGEPGDLGTAQLAADLRGSLEEQHVATGRGEGARGDQSGDSTTDHDHVPHATSLGCRAWTPT